VKQTDPRKVYNATAKYFGLRARDAFLNAVSDTTAGSDEAASKTDQYTHFLDKIFSQGHTFDTIEQLKKIADAPGDQEAKFKERFCATTPDGTGFDKIYNTAGEDQGWGAAKGKKFKLSEMANGLDVLNSPLLALQVFPIATGLDITDTEITSLFLNSLRTLEMSRAVPYIDVRIISSADGAGEGNFKEAPKMSLGRFLGVSSKEGDADAMLAKFVPPVDAEGSKGAKLNVVAGMEVFTSPQTLVNNNREAYSRETAGRTDIFRPFMGLMGLTIADQFSGGSTISYKSAQMNLKLFDKGRLNEVAEFVAPRRDPNIKFEITYGWSHPDGANLSRKSDADVNTRLGALIDAMRLTELYTLNNSSYSVAADGTVDISLTLSMDSSAAMTSHDISSLSLLRTDTTGGISMQALYSQLKSIKDRLGESPGVQNGKIAIPVFLQAPTPENIITLSKEAIKEIRKFYQTLTSHYNQDKELKAIGKDLFKIFHWTNKKNTSTLSKVKAGRAKVAQGFVGQLIKTPDPFLRSNMTVTKTKLASGGIREDKDVGSKKQHYVSFGKLVIAAMAPALDEKDTEMHFIFSSMNHNAAGTFDYNLAQFPINAEDLKGQLEALLKKTPVVTTEMFVRFLSEKFLAFEGSEAFGLSDIFEPNGRTRSGSKKVGSKLNNTIVKRAVKGDPGAQLRVQKIERANLDRVYGAGKRVYPTFTKPRVNIRIVKKRSTTDPKKDVLRIYIQDTAAGRLMSTADALMTLVRDGHVTQDDYSGPGGGIRGALHGEIYTKNFDKLSNEENGFIGPPDAAFMEELDTALAEHTVLSGEEKEAIKARARTYKVLKKAPGNIRKFFYDTSPYLFHGTEGSGLIEAQLSAEADQNLTNLALLAAYSDSGDASVPKRPINLPFGAHPSTLSVTTFGCPFFALTQKYFVDFGTNTTMDNFYVAISCEHSISPTEFKTAVTMKPYDAYGAFVNLNDEAEKILLKSLLADIKKQAMSKK